MPDVNEAPTDPNDDPFTPGARKLYERLKSVFRQEVRARRVSKIEACGVATMFEAWAENELGEAIATELGYGDDADDADGLSGFAADPDAWKKGGGR